MSKYNDWYKSARWKEIRRKRLAANPWCVMCAAMDTKTRATIVDHTIRHRGNEKLFYDYANTQSLCKLHHDSVKKSNEYIGFDKRIGSDGWPIDSQHPFNKAKVRKEH